MFTNLLCVKAHIYARMHALVVFFLMFIGAAQLATAQSQKPNIILILADDVGYKSLTCNGGTLYSTPNIDTLAQNGMRFTRCHTSPTCSPSRFLLLTGKYNFRNYTEWGVMTPGEKTVGTMMKDAGYKTAFFGKSQLEGGGQSINSWGFDEYCVHDPFKASSAGSKYKNPHIYTHGAFLPDNLTLNKYGPDVVSDSLFAFMETNRANPFFIYYPMILVHKPMSPTPNDPAFSGWDPKNHSDTSFFSSMMNYMDKEIGDLIVKLKELGIYNNTIIIYAGDNGTPGVVPDFVDDNDSIILGGKHLTAESAPVFLS